MTQVLNSDIKNEILEIKNRIENTQTAYIKQYCVEAPLDLRKEIFLELLAIDQKVNSYKFITTSDIYNLNFVNAKLNYEKILRKLKKVVNKIQCNYYFELVNTVKLFIFKLNQDEVMQPIEVELSELVKLLRKKSYIQNHKEYEKIAEFIKWKECIYEIPYERAVHHTYKMLGIKGVLTQYEKYLSDVLTVEDINLKRAVFAYLDDTVDFGFVDRL